MPKNKVLACGTFDLLHPGHLFFLRTAKKLGTHLTVLVAHNQTVQKIKKHLPQENQAQRAKNIAKLDFVDTIKLAEVNNFLHSLQEVRPDILALGYDQKLPLPRTKILTTLPHLQITRLPAHLPHIHKTTLKKLELNANP